MSKPGLLFLSHRLPYPPHNGAAIRTFNTLKLLARDFQITSLCFDRRDPATTHLPLEERVAALRPYTDVEVFPIPQETSRVRLAVNHVKSLLSGRAYTFYVHDSREFVARLRHHLKHGHYDLVHLDSLDLVRALEETGPTPVICTHHNVESHLLHRRAAAERGLRRWYLRLQAERLEAEERCWMPRVALNVAVSPADAEALQRLAPAGRFATVPNGVDTDYFQPDAGAGEGLVFVGGTTWFPNRDGLAWFAEAILPELRRLEPTAPVTWVGRATDAERRRYDGLLGMRLTGYVDDIRPHVARAAAFIVPLRVGGGTRLKILDAWAMGKALVSTPIGCEGLPAVNGENILLAENPLTFAAAASRLLRDGELRTRLGVAARRMVESEYSWSAIGATVRHLYLPLTRQLPTTAADEQTRGVYPPAG